MQTRNKSTNVRFIDAVRWIGRRHPQGLSRVATGLFFMPPRPRGYAWGDPALLRQGQRLALAVGGRSVRAWRFGRGPQVLVQHGWGGRTLQMTPVIQALMSAGFSVLALDAPGHGASGWRPASSIVHFADAIEELLRRHGPAFATVAHSLGGVAAAHSRARGNATGPLILVAPFSRPERFYQGFLSHLGLAKASVQEAQSRAEQTLGVRFGDLDLATALRGTGDSTWIIHDRDDGRVPFRGSQQVADTVAGVRLHATRGLGHSRVLADPQVHGFILDVLAGLPGDRLPVGRAPSTCERDLVPSMHELLADLEYGRA